MTTRIYNATSYAARHPTQQSNSEHQADSTRSGTGSGSGSSPPFLSSSAPTLLDPYYGEEVFSKQAARYVTCLFSCPDSSQSKPSTRPSCALARFIAYSIYRARLPLQVGLSALTLLRRLKTRFPGSTGSSGHRLWLCSYMISSKALCDDTYSNRSWSTCGMGMFSITEVNQMEREMLQYLGWNINCGAEDLESVQALLDTHFTCSAKPSPTSAQLLLPSCQSSSSSSPSRSTVSYPSPPVSPAPISIPSSTNSHPAPSTSSTSASSPDYTPHSPSDSSLSSSTSTIDSDSTMPEPSTPSDAERTSFDDGKLPDLEF